MDFLRRGTTCCDPFSGLLADAGRRGLAIIVRRDRDGLSFDLQSRGIDHRDRAKLVPIPGAPDVFVNLSMSVAIKHCPFCGQRLSRLVRHARATHERLADEHEPYVDRILP
jgi:hypothetical protein